MDPFAPDTVPRHKRLGGIAHENNEAQRDFRATMTVAQQQLYTPRVGTTRFAVDMDTKRPAKFRSSQQHKSLTTMYDKRPNLASAISIKLDSMAENSTMNGLEETELGDKKKRSGDGGGGQSKKKQKTGKGAGGKKAKGKKMLAKPKVDNRTKWRRRLAIDGNEGHSNGENDGLGAKNYVAVGMTAPEAKKTALENCILVYVPPKRTAAEAKIAVEKKKQMEQAQKRAGFPPTSQEDAVVMPGQSTYKLDKNGKPSLAPGQHVDKAGMPVEGPRTHRASCHRCGNLRRKILVCPRCPHVFCLKCGEKMFEEHGLTTFERGCVVCKEICCCGINRNDDCTRKFHCYKKCPAMKKIQKKKSQDKKKSTSTKEAKGEGEVLP